MPINVGMNIAKEVQWACEMVEEVGAEANEEPLET
jgi:hypothetical protein